MSTTPPGARYEIIQSEIAARWTFRLDRFTGKIDQLVSTSENKNAWEAMLVDGLPQIKKPNTPRFILFTSGLAARHTFLLDSSTGKTWVLTTVLFQDNEGKSNEVTVWKPFEE